MPRLTLLLSLVFLSSFSKMEQLKKDDGSVKSILVGKKVSDSPFNEYIKTDLQGDQVILLIVYGCGHCRDAAIAVKKLKDAKLISDVIVLGSEAGEAGTKKEFMEIAGNALDCTVIDYDWETLPKKFTGPEPKMSPPPLAFYIHDNVIKKIYSVMPAEKEFRKAKAQ